MTFGNSFFVAPNVIDFSTVFLKFSPLSQGAVLGTLSGIGIMFVLVIIWAVGNDRNDVYRVSFISLHQYMQCCIQPMNRHVLKVNERQ